MGLVWTRTLLPENLYGSNDVMMMSAVLVPQHLAWTLDAPEPHLSHLIVASSICPPGFKLLSSGFLVFWSSGLRVFWSSGLLIFCFSDSGSLKTSQNQEDPSRPAEPTSWRSLVWRLTQNWGLTRQESSSSRELKNFSLPSYSFFAFSWTDLSFTHPHLLSHLQRQKDICPSIQRQTEKMSVLLSSLKMKHQQEILHQTPTYLCLISSGERRTICPLPDSDSRLLLHISSLCSERVWKLN